MAAPNFSNRTLFHGDNLPFLRGMDSETVDLVATDPPFNKSKDFHATPDSLASGARFTDRWSWDKDVHPDWVDAITDDWPGVWAVIEAARAAHGEDMAAFLCWLGVRIMELHRILKPTGSLYLHIDHTAHAYAKALLDGVFGARNFRNELVWSYGGRGAKAVANQFPRNHDIILYYSKAVGQHGYTRQHLGRKMTPAEAKKRGMMQEKDGRWFKTAPRGDYTDESVARLESEGRIYRTRTGTVRVKYHLKGTATSPVEDVLVGDVWRDIPDAMHLPKNERMNFPTQKPLALYERIIKASSNPGDLVLDPFCGCATTPVAAERLGRQWVGMDIWDGAFDIVQKRMENNRQLLVDDVPTITYATTAPVRTDTGQEAAPTLVLKLQIPEPPGPKMSHSEMRAMLVQNHGIVCQGCLRKFDDERYLDLDHNVPRSDGGINHISNRMLLCGPCNRAKSNTLTLSGLRRLNRKNGWMASE